MTCLYHFLLVDKTLTSHTRGFISYRFLRIDRVYGCVNLRFREIEVEVGASAPAKRSAGIRSSHFAGVNTCRPFRCTESESSRPNARLSAAESSESARQLNPSIAAIETFTFIAEPSTAIAEFAETGPCTTLSEPVETECRTALGAFSRSATECR